MIKNCGLSANELLCIRNERILFSDLSFHLCDGEALQITGPNGAGKSSLLRIISGLIKPTAGAVYWPEGKSQLAYLGHKIAIKLGLTVAENLRTVRLNSEALLEQSELKNVANFLCQKLSAGQRQRVALTRLLASPAKLWILDEPCTALDQNGIRWIESRLINHVNAGGLVVFTSHQPLNLTNIILKKIALV